MYWIYAGVKIILLKCTESTPMWIKSISNALDPRWCGYDPSQMHWIHVCVNKINIKYIESTLVWRKSLTKIHQSNTLNLCWCEENPFQMYWIYANVERISFKCILCGENPSQMHRIRTPIQPYYFGRATGVRRYMERQLLRMDIITINIHWQH